MKNTIANRVADFLKNYPPFKIMPKEELETLAGEVTILYKDKDQVVFGEGETPHAHFYVVHKGAIALGKPESDSIVDICDEGDVFGLRPLIANEPYKMEARAQEECILYAVPIVTFKPYALGNAEVGTFLLESFAANTLNPYTADYRGQWLESDGDLNLPSTQLLDFQPVNYSKKVIGCKPDTTAQNAAIYMIKKKVGALLVLEDGLPIGILTNKDLRNQVVTGQNPISVAVSQIMSSPVITYPPSLTVTQAQMAMMKSGISHLCLTQDGTPNTKAIGVLSRHDVMLAVGNNPADLMKAIKRSKKTKQLRRVRNSIKLLLQDYLKQNLPLGMISSIISELNDATRKQVITLALAKMEEQPPVPFAWLAMGSQGRSEQFLQTDQDNALVFADVPHGEYPKTKDYFLQLAKQINKGLHAIGYEYCPADMMASNPNWCHSISQWKAEVGRWIQDTGSKEVLLSAIFFDFTMTYGNKELVDQLANHIFETADKSPLFYARLAGGALQNPSPTGFFRQFLVEEDGAHKDQFDLKMRALMPLVDAARILILSHNVQYINNTWERYEKLADLEANNRDLFLACAHATRVLVKFRTQHGLQNNDSGRFIALDKLTKTEKIRLKQTFKTIKQIQELVTIRFKVSNIQ